MFALEVRQLYETNNLSPSSPKRCLPCMYFGQDCYEGQEDSIWFNRGNKETNSDSSSNQETFPEGETREKKHSSSSLSSGYESTKEENFEKNPFFQVLKKNPPFFQIVANK